MFHLVYIQLYTFHSVVPTYYILIDWLTCGHYHHTKNRHLTVPHKRCFVRVDFSRSDCFIWSFESVVNISSIAAAVLPDLHAEMLNSDHRWSWVHHRRGLGNIVEASPTKTCCCLVTEQLHKIIFPPFQKVVFLFRYCTDWTAHILHLMLIN